MTRQVMCLSGERIAKQVDEAQCSAITRPQSRRVCKTTDCKTTLYSLDKGEDAQVGYYWRITMWTPVRCCTVSVAVLTYEHTK